MTNIYVSLTLSLIGVFLAYFLLSKILLVVLFLTILAVLHFKDDFIIFRYLATHVASISLWFCEVNNYLVNMYHQSNNVNLPVRKRIEDNGTVSNKVDRVNHRLKTAVSHNPNLSYVLETQPLGTSTLNSNPNVPPKLALYNSRSQSPLQDLSKLNLNSSRLREDSINKTKFSPSASPKIISAVNYNKENPLGNVSITSGSSSASQTDKSPLLDTRLFANVNSPGFCSRLAERLGDTMTHQPQYDTVGAFPVVNLKSQSPKVKVKAPVRVRLAPPSSELCYSNVGARHTPLAGAEESMKSVLQVLKEISRKRIHSNVEEDSEDNSKRLRIGESQCDAEGSQQTSLLQQTIQGKRAREESSPNEDDIKKRRKPLHNNEILSSLSSSISIKAPHLKTQKRKALDDPITLTPVLGKLLKVQPETPSPTITPPPNNKATVQDCNVKDTPTPMLTSTWQEPTPVKPAETIEVKAVAKTASPEADDDGVVSRLLGRMSSQVDQTALQPIPVKKDVFASTNDLSLSPPKENRLAAMIAVLGGPREELGIKSTLPDSGRGSEKTVKGKSLFTTPETPETPKSTKKVTFSESLTSTKIFEKNSPSNGGISSSFSAPSIVSHTPPLSAVTAGISSSPILLDQKPASESQSPNVSKPVENIGFSLPQFTTGNESLKKNDGINNSTAVSNNSTPSQQPSNFLSTMVSSSLNSSNTSTAIDANAKFGSNILSSQDKNDSLAKQPSAPGSVAEKPFSFGGLQQTTQASSGFASPTTNSTSQSLENKATPTQGADIAGQTKLSFNMFGNKNSSESNVKNVMENKFMMNGLDSSNQVSFNFSASPSLTGISKPTGPSSSTMSDNTAKTNAPFSFGSSTTSQISSSSTFQFGSTTPTASSTVPSSTNPQPSQPNNVNNVGSNQFSVAVSSNPQSSSIFKNSIAQSNVTNSSTLPSSQSSIFGNSATLAFGATSKIGENKAASVTQNNLFGGISSNTTSTAQSDSLPSTTEATKSKGFGFAGNSPFGGLASTTTQSSSIFGNTLTTQSSTMFGSVATKSTSLSSPATTTGQPPAFNLGTSKSIFPNASTTPAFGAVNSSPAFGSQTTSTATFMGQSTPTFGSQVSSSTGAFGAQTTTTTGFGNQNAATNAFGSQNTSTTTAFGNQITSPTNAFGGQSTSTNAFGNQAASSTNAFGNQNLTNTFGSQNSSSNAFGSQSAPSTVSSTPFGNQTTVATPTFNQSQNSTISNFGNQTVTKPATFENQTNILNTQTGFNTTGTFSIGQNNTNTAAGPKPSPFGSSSFSFGSSLTNKDSNKPIGAAAPFSFAPTAQASPSMASSSQPTVPTFGASTTTFGSQQPPAFGGTQQPPAFGGTQQPPAFGGTQQPPAFGGTQQSPAFGGTQQPPAFGGTQQPPAFGGSQQPPAFGGSQQQPAFGSTVSQPATAGPVFSFGQNATAPGSTFQFNAAGPQPVQGGGMFSIGSGSMAPRSKTGAQRRRHKPT